MNCLRLHPLLLLLICLPLLAGCGDDDVSSEVSEATATPEPIPPTETLPAPILARTLFDVQAIAGPEYRYPLVDRVPGNTDVVVTGQNSNGSWLEVDLDGRPAWIAHWALEYEENILPVAESEAPYPQDMRREVRPDTPPPLAFGYGLQAHMIGTIIEDVMVATRDLEFNWLKQQIRWSITEPEPRTYRWSDLDLIVDRATYSDINLLFSVVTTPAWAREADFDVAVHGPPSDPQLLADFLSSMAARYCGTSLRAIEVWNEQNLHYEWGNLPLVAEDYVDLLAVASAAIRNACPSLYIISGALTPTGTNNTPQSRRGTTAVDDFIYLQQMLVAGVSEYVDAIGAHPSGYNVPARTAWPDACAAIIQFGNSFNGACDNAHHSWSFRSTMEGYHSLLQQHDVNLPVWPTEFGWAAGGAYHPAYGYANDNDFDEQAQWTLEAFSMMKAWGWVAPPILWNLNFRVIADGTERAQWGIVDKDWSPLPVYTALKAMDK